MQGEEARRFTLTREHPEHTLHANVDGAGRDVGTVEVAGVVELAVNRMTTVQEKGPCGE